MGNAEVRAADRLHETEAYREQLSRGVEDVAAAISSYEQLVESGHTEIDTSLELAKSYRLRADANFKLLHQDAAENDYRQALKVSATLVMRNPNVYRYRMPMAETQYNLCNLLFFQNKTQQATQLLANCRSTLLEAIRIDPENGDAARELVRFTSNTSEALAEMGDFDVALQVITSAVGELQALRQESAEYSKLDPQIEKLKAKAADLTQRKSKAEKHDGVL